jgi:transposase
VKIEFLPPYSPDFNPIEYTFSVIKKALRAENVIGYGNSAAELENFANEIIRIAEEKITPEMARNQYRHCNLHVV